MNRFCKTMLCGFLEGIALFCGLIFALSIGHLLGLVS